MRLTFAIILLFIVFTVPGSAQSAVRPSPVFSWRGLYVGAQSVTPIDRAPTRIGDYAITANVIIGIKKSYSIQFQFIVPVNGRRPVYRLGFDRRLF